MHSNTNIRHLSINLPIHKAQSIVKLFNPQVIYNYYQQYILREKAEKLLDSISKIGHDEFRGNILVDAMWDNPNYWIRYTLLRSALGISAGKEVGVLGRYRAKYCSTTLKRFGIKDIFQITDLYGDKKNHNKYAALLLNATEKADDILHWELPHNVPPRLVYDGILKRQRAAYVNLHDPKLIDYLTEALCSIEASHRTLEMHDFTLLVLSHAINFQYGSLAWLALKRGIPVILLYGNYGVPRFARLTKPEDIFNSTDRPGLADIEKLTAIQCEGLIKTGTDYLKKRRAGQTDDIGANYAYKKRQGSIKREQLIDHFGWNPIQPVIAVYAANWFDFPGGCGMTHFRDFAEWLEETIKVAIANRNVNWLFKAHPCDDWYGGVTLSDLMPKASHNHIRLSDKTWNGSALMDCIDGVVTYHGTAGIEFAATGKPVLLADRGWYHDVGFARCPKSRKEYMELLSSSWWEAIDLKETTRLAQIFAGWYFGKPAWQDSFLLDDDSTQWAIYEKVPSLILKNKDIISKEIALIREWFHSGHPHYHTFKMMHADNYIS